jgi:hypothetical protein
MAVDRCSSVTGYKAAAAAGKPSASPFEPVNFCMWILIIKPQPSRTYREMVRNGFNSWSDSAERDCLLSVDLETLRHYGRPFRIPCGPAISLTTVSLSHVQWPISWRSSF